MDTSSSARCIIGWPRRGRPTLGDSRRRRAADRSASPAGSAPVALYAAVFVCVDIAYNVFEREVLAGAKASQVSHRPRRTARRRSLAVLAIFASAILVAFV